MSRPGCCVAAWRGVRNLVRGRPRARNQVQAVVIRNLGGRAPASDTFGKKGRAWLAGLQLPAFSWLGKLEPQWSYRLDEAMTQFLIHDGDLSVAAAAQAIENSNQPIDYAFELELKPAGDDERPSEHDIFLSDGARLWVGEATHQPRLGETSNRENSRLDRLSALAELLGARYVLLANGGTWSKTTCTAANERFPSSWPQLKWMNNVPAVPRPKPTLKDRVGR